MMEQAARGAVILSLMKQLRERGSWCGATDIQKTAYFLQTLTDVHMGLDFILYKHGPYSFGLRDHITQLVAYGFVKRVPDQPPYAPHLEVTERGEKLIHSHRETVEAAEEHITFISEHLAQEGIAVLERLGTALLFTLNGATEADQETRARAITEAKPHVSPEEALEAVKRVDRIRAEWAAVAP